MDLGITGKKALICAASKGLGKACAFSLARNGAEVTIVARSRDALEATASEIAIATGVTVHAVTADITTPGGREQALAAAPEPDILVNNAGGPPPGDFRDWTQEHWISALNANMLTPIELIKAVIDGMIARKFGRIVNITSSSVKSPIPFLGLSNGARYIGLLVEGGALPPELRMPQTRSEPASFVPRHERASEGSRLGNICCQIRA